MLNTVSNPQESGNISIIYLTGIKPNINMNSDYMRNYMRNRRKNRRKFFVELLGGKCKSCGSTNDLQFDHVNPKKKNSDFNDIQDGDHDLLLKEVEKCVLLCPECHLEKTKANKEHVNKNKQPSTHGKIWHYKNYGCRCSKCRLAMKLYNLKNKK